MKIGFEISRSGGEARAGSVEDPKVPISNSTEVLALFGLAPVKLPHVSVESALTVPAVLAAVTFLSRTLATLPLHAYRSTKDGPVRLTDRTATTIHDAPNELMGSFKFRQYFWQQVFTGGRGLAWIERDGSVIEAIWPMDPRKTMVRRKGFDVIYRFENKEYPAADVIDIPFMLREDQIAHRGPITMAAKAIQLALAMNDYGSTFFAGGGVPPLALEGPVPSAKGGLERAMADVSRVIDAARKSDKPVFPLPPNHKLTPVGFDPEKGQMTEARLFQIQEIARAYQMPPAFLQDLSRGTFANVEQQDLHLVKHLIGQWAKAFEDEANLKLFGRGKNGRYVEHNLDGLMRGDFKSRIEGIARAIQTAQLTPNEGRALENRPKHKNPNADELLVQGATVVLGKQPTKRNQPTTPKKTDNGDGNEPEA